MPRQSIPLTIPLCFPSFLVLAPCPYQTIYLFNLSLASLHPSVPLFGLRHKVFPVGSLVYTVYRHFLPLWHSFTVPPLSVLPAETSPSPFVQRMSTQPLHLHPSMYPCHVLPTAQRPHTQLPGLARRMSRDQRSITNSFIKSSRNPACQTTKSHREQQILRFPLSGSPRRRKPLHHHRRHHYHHRRRPFPFLPFTSTQRHSSRNVWTAISKQEFPQCAPGRRFQTSTPQNALRSKTQIAGGDGGRQRQHSDVAS